MCHWGQWEPAHHPAQAEWSGLDKMRSPRALWAPDHQADTQGPSQTSSSNILWWLCAHMAHTGLHPRASSWLRSLMPFYSLCCLWMLECESEGQMGWILRAVGKVKMGQDGSKWDSRERRDPQVGRKIAGKCHSLPSFQVFLIVPDRVLEEQCSFNLFHELKKNNAGMRQNNWAWICTGTWNPPIDWRRYLQWGQPCHLETSHDWCPALSETACRCSFLFIKPNWNQGSPFPFCPCPWMGMLVLPAS